MNPEVLNGAAQEWIARLGTVCWQGALAAVAVWLVCRSGRIPARVRCWLWWAISVRLLVGLVPIEGVPLYVLPAARATREAGPISPKSPLSPMRVPRYEVPAARTEPGLRDAPSLLSSPTIAPANTPSVAPFAWLLLAWLVGVAICLVRSARQCLAVRRLVCRARPAGNGHARTVLDRLLEDAEVRGTVDLREHPAVRSPLVAGVRRPVILLPPDAVSSLSPDELRVALAHEVVHLRRRDLLFSVLPGLAQAVFFFHPFAWLAAREHRLALEAACDLDALRLTGVPISDYGRLLLRFAGGAECRTAAALGAASSFRILERRLTLLRTAPSYPSRASRLAAGLALVVVAGLVIPWRLEAQRAAKKRTRTVTAVGQSLPSARSATTTVAPVRAAGRVQSVRPVVAPRGGATVAASPAATVSIAPAVAGVATASSPSAVTIAPSATAASPAAVGQTAVTSPVTSAAVAQTPTSVTGGPAAIASPVAGVATVSISGPVGQLSGTRAASGVSVAQTAVAPVAPVRNNLSTPSVAGRVTTVSVAGTADIAATAQAATNVTQPAQPSSRNTRVQASPQAGSRTSRTRPAPAEVVGVADDSVRPSGLTTPSSTAPVGTVRTAGRANTGLATSAPFIGGVRGSHLATAPRLQFKGLPLSAALRTLFSRTRSDYVLALGNLGDTEISGDFDGSSLENVLDAMLNRANLSGRLVTLDEDNIRVVTSARETTNPGRVTLRFQKRDATEALSALFSAAHVGCVISSELHGQVLTASFANMDFQTAVDTLLRSFTRPVTYRVEKGIYHVTPRE
jgi:beta-lactamase regulating signal transducer with metallopeptidase domain